MATISRSHLVSPLLAALGLLSSEASAQSLVEWGGPLDVNDILALSKLNNPVDIECGAVFSLALKPDGKVYGWGDTGSLGKNVPTDLTNVVKIAAGEDNGMALLSNGTVRVWGPNNQGQRNVPAGLTGVVGIASGGGHCLALKSDGTVVGWGSNAFGETTIPAGLDNVVKVTATGMNSMALKSNGTVVAWGYSNSPLQNVPAGLSNVVDIDLGRYAAVAVKSDGTVVTWGDNTMKQLNVPAGLSGVVRAESGADRTVALKADGTVVCWGRNTNGQCTPPPTLHGVIDIAAGGTYEDKAFPTWVIGRALQTVVEDGFLIVEDTKNGFVDIGDPAPAGGAVVELRQSPELVGWMDLPATVTVPAGQTRVTFPVNAPLRFGNASGTYQAAFGGRVSVPREFFVAGQTVSLTLLPGSISPGSATVASARIELGRTARSNITLSLSTGTPYYTPTSSPIFTIPAGERQALIPISHSLIPKSANFWARVLNGDAELTGSYLSLTAIVPRIYPVATSVKKGEDVMATLRLAPNVRDAAKVTLTSSSNAVTVPATLTVPAGTRDLTFPIHGNAGGSAVITASFNDNVHKVTIIVDAPRVTAVELPASVSAQKYFTGTVRIDRPAPVGGQGVTFSSPDPGVRAAASVTIPQGATSASFSIVSNDVAVPQEARVVAESDGSTLTGTTTVRPLAVKSFAISTATIQGGLSLEGTVTLAEAVGVNTPLSIESADPSVVIVPSSTTIIKNTAVRTFLIKTKAVAAAKFVKITVKKNGTTAYRTLKVTP
ncbi:MAG: hypothetical protein EON58_03575 [Alphaproteobacteria bacterium]|nr:MAG: hypothetical protein EON58_03575 [Alphaproteobacteria bacterium]